MNFAVPSDHRVKMKEIEKRLKYLDLVRQLRKSWNVNSMKYLIVKNGMNTNQNQSQKQKEHLFSVTLLSILIGKLKKTID